MYSSFIEIVLKNWLQFVMICVVLTFCLIKIIEAVDPIDGIIRFVRTLTKTLIHDELTLRFKAAIVNLLLAILVFLLAIAILTPSVVQQLGLTGETDVSSAAIVVFILFCLVVLLSLLYIWKTRELVDLISGDED